MRVNIERLQANFEGIVAISASEEGCTRLSYSREDVAVREILKEQMQSLGMQISVDGVGNIRGKYNPMRSSQKSIFVGSHIDTVPKGGKYDGLTGVLAGLEAISTIKEQAITIQKPIELIIFAEEEGSNFGITMLGSKCLAGDMGYEELTHIYSHTMVPALDIMRDAGLDPQPTTICKLDDSIEAMVELHVEQGGILEHEKIPIGIVESIVGMQVMKIIIKGKSNHAGTTPMHLRWDPLVAAGQLFYEIPNFPQKYGGPRTVATVGKVYVMPNGSNVIPSEVEFYVDIRDVDSTCISSVCRALEEYVGQLCMEKGLSYKIETVGKSEPVHLSPKVIGLIEEIAKRKGISYLKMPSGAVHDAAMMVKCTEVGMIFLPSVEGTSHSPFEHTDFGDIILGTELLLDVLIRLAQ